MTLSRVAVQVLPRHRHHMLVHLSCLQPHPVCYLQALSPPYYLQAPPPSLPATPSILAPAYLLPTCNSPVLRLQLDDAFDFGQTYVALSRARSLAGLWIQGGAVTQAAVKAHPAVIAFYRQTP
eukprot:2749213-Rhodomonas_salina.1